MQHLQRAFDGQNQWWKYLVITLLGFLGPNLVGSLPLLVVLFVKTFNAGKSFSAVDINNLQSVGISMNLGLFLMLLPFTIGFITVALLSKLFHQRTLNEVINGTKRFRWGRYFFAIFLWGALTAVAFGIDYFRDPSNFTFHLNWSSFITLIFISLLLLPLQTGFEEVLFRGYYMQGIATGTRSKWAAVLITGISFGLIHIANPEIAAYGLLITLPQYILFGIFFGIIAVLDDGIELTMGAHMMNNFFVCTVVTFKASALPTEALFTQRQVHSERDLVVFILISLLFIFIAARKYKWNFSVLNQRLEKPDIITGKTDDGVFDDQMRNA